MYNSTKSIIEKWINWGSSIVTWPIYFPKILQDAALHTFCEIKQNNRSSASNIKDKIKLELLV